MRPRGTRRAAAKWLSACLMFAILSASILTAQITPAGAEPMQADPLANRFGGPFELTTIDGRRVTDRTFRGQFMLVYFGYTHCPDICPTGLANLSAVLDDLGRDAANLQSFFITVDPARDTTEHLAEYAKSFHRTLVMLTGSEADVAAVTRAYKVHRRKYLWKQTQTGGDTPSADDYGVDHGSLMYLMGRDGRFVTLFPHATPPETIAATLRRYLMAEHASP